MTSYVSSLKTWGDTGTEYPTGYSYTGGSSGVPPVAERENFVNYHVIEDIKHLVSLTNSRLDTSASSTAPSSPTDGQIWWDTTNYVVKIYDANTLGWKQFAFNTDLTNHTSSTSNPHSVTAAQVGSYTKAESDTNFAAASHNHDTRYYTESESDSKYATKTEAKVNFNHISAYHQPTTGSDGGWWTAETHNVSNAMLIGGYARAENSQGSDVGRTRLKCTLNNGNVVYFGFNGKTYDTYSTSTKTWNAVEIWTVDEVTKFEIQFNCDDQRLGEFKAVFIENARVTTNA